MKKMNKQIYNLLRSMLFSVARSFCELLPRSLLFHSRYIAMLPYMYKQRRVERIAIVRWQTTRPRAGSSVFISDEKLLCSLRRTSNRSVMVIRVSSECDR